MSHKKYLTLLSTATLLTVSLLGACSSKPSKTPTSSSQKQTSSQQQTKKTTDKPKTSSQSSSATPASSSENPSEESLPVASMDTAALLKGDYTTVIGTWQTKNGSILVFNTLGLTNGMKISGETKMDGPIFTTYASPDSSPVGSGALLMVPKGTALLDKFLHETSDISNLQQDRLFAVQSLLTAEMLENDAYYRVSQSANSGKNPLTNQETGVSLESGDITLEYANLILGNRSWSIIESNYNRTQSIPFEMLQGDNGALFRIYKNGVIVSENLNQIVYQP